MSIVFTIPKFKIWIVTLETFIYEDNNIFNAILCQWHYYIPNFKFLAIASTLPIN